MKRRLLLLLAAVALISAAGGFYFRLQEGMEAAEVLRKLSGMRLALELYRQENKDLPAAFGDTVKAGVLEEAFGIKLKGHLARSGVRNSTKMEIRDSGGWAYVNDRSDVNFGLLYIDCAHRDEKGRFWSEF